MLVCHCQAQTDKAIRQCIAEGARTECDLAERCGAGAACGGCLPELQMILAELNDTAVA